MPQLGETVTEGTITRWFKQVGDTVAADEPLFEVSTDKVDSEVPAPTSGVVTEILVPEGDTVDVGARLAVIADGAAAPGARAAPRRLLPPAEPEPAPAPAAPPAAAAPPPPPAPPAPPVPRRAAPPAAPAAPAMQPAAPAAEAARERRRRSGHLAARATHDRRAGTRSRRRSAAPATAVASRATTCVEAERGRVAAARRRLRTAAPRTGGPPRPPPRRLRPRRPRPQRRAAPRCAHAWPATTSRAVRQHPPPHRRAHGALQGDERARVHVGRGRLRARRARPARATRRAWQAEEGFSLTYLPFIVRAFCDVVHDYPNVNASVDGDSLVVHHDIHLGIAVDLDFKGLRRAGRSATPTASGCG